MFLPLTGIPMRKRARTRTLLAVWLPDPLTVAATMQKLLTPAGLSWRSVTSGPLCTLVVLMKPVATPAPEPPGADVAPPFARRSAHIADCFCCLSHPRAQVDTRVEALRRPEYADRARSHVIGEHAPACAGFRGRRGHTATRGHARPGGFGETSWPAIRVGRRVEHQPVRRRVTCLL